jgi:hypothetical protein
MANPAQRAKEEAANAEAQRRHREVQKLATYTRQQRRRADFILEFQAVTAELDLPRKNRRLVARNRLKQSRRATADGSEAQS